jgi:hypothetical protein
MKDITSGIPKYCINLQHRTDRLQSSKEIFKNKINLINK